MIQVGNFVSKGCVSWKSNPLLYILRVVVRIRRYRRHNISALIRTTAKVLICYLNIIWCIKLHLLYHHYNNDLEVHTTTTWKNYSSNLEGIYKGDRTRSRTTKWHHNGVLSILHLFILCKGIYLSFERSSIDCNFPFKIWKH